MSSTTPSIPADNAPSADSPSHNAQAINPDQDGPRVQPSNTDIGASDRVYPIRSIVSVEHSPTTDSPPHTLRSPLSPTGDARGYSVIDYQARGSRRPRSESKTDSLATSSDSREMPGSSGPASQHMSRTSPTRLRSDTPGSHKEGDKHAFIPASQEDPDPDAGGLVTSRFRHVVTDDGHAVITGRTVDSFKACEDEPIHIPGAVQSFGALVAVREEAGEKMVVRVVSENSEAILGYSPAALFSLRNFCDILPADQADLFLDNVDFLRDNTYDPAIDGPEVFIVTVNCPGGGTVRLWCAMHIAPGSDGLIICEFELEDDQTNPLTFTGQGSPATPASTLDVIPTEDQLAGSTININQPLRALRRARRHKGETAAMEVFSIVSQIQEQLGRTESMGTLLDTTAGIVKELTGFHRILVYQFDSEFNGKVVSELVDPTVSIDLFKGLHFPAADIPKQARDLYRINKVRLLYDRDQVTARLVCRTLEDLETPLDMTYGYLRAMSPIHIKYLANMAIRSSMSISIKASDDLWGLISCHGYGNRGMRVSFPIRKMCRLIGDTVARNVERLSYASRLQARKLINTVPTDANPSGYIVASSDDLLHLVDADYGALCIRGKTKILANSPRSQELLALVEYLKVRKIGSVVASKHITKDFKDLYYPPGFKDISGLLYVPLSTDGQDFIVFFRRGQLTEVKWGGNPNEAKFTEGHLEPRKSFLAWRELVLDQCREWTESEVDTAAVLCLVYGKFIKVWRQHEEVLENSNLTKLLLANSAHEVRTPLNAIVNYLEIAMEGALDGDTRDHLSKSYSASKSLIYVINDLLDLTNVEQGQSLIKDEPFPLQATITEATDMFGSEVKRKGLSYTVLVHPGLPETVIGDQRRVRQSVSNLISNAVQHTTSGGVTVEAWPAPGDCDPGKVTVKIAVLDTGEGIPDATLGKLFRELEQISGEDDSQYYADNGASSQAKVADGREKPVLGLGLALVARIVRTMQGQLIVRSEVGKGSRFQLSLQFPVPQGSRVETPSLTGMPVKTRDSVTAFPSKEDKILVDSTSPAASKRNSLSGESGREQASTADHGIPSPTDHEKDKGPSRGPTVDADAAASRLLAEQKGPKVSGDKTASRTPQTSAPTLSQATSSASEPSTKRESRALGVSVAEDDPINAKILEKRLGKLGYTVRRSVNGEECANAYAEDPTQIDVVLMDIQMPILDGIGSTKRIRQFENGPESAAFPGIHVPIFAVSASLLEKDAQMYMDAGFDGWIMKPINFNRLSMLFAGIHDEQARNGEVYQSGQWEKGGWFTPFPKA
ncbi:hypothetical protein BJX61DRAFT_48586 [Aspergillus egyptiacus]|nr:hypothetical protein BJX61DRAFT_48586 [Aspergillus egyptiacus]